MAHLTGGWFGGGDVLNAQITIISIISILTTVFVRLFDCRNIAQRFVLFVVQIE